MDVENNIDYHKLVQASDFYTSYSFGYRHMPWCVTPEISEVTKPEFCKDFWIKDKVLMGSAEQGFIQLLIEKKLPPGRWQALTPCFRDDMVDFLHQKYFMKLELIDTKNVNFSSLMNIIEICMEWFQRFLAVEMVQTKEGYDIIDRKTQTELGSYGMREYRGFEWIFATGCAEPRLSKVVYLNSQQQTVQNAESQNFQKNQIPQK